MPSLSPSMGVQFPCIEVSFIWGSWSSFARVGGGGRLVCIWHRPTQQSGCMNFVTKSTQPGKPNSRMQFPERCNQKAARDQWHVTIALGCLFFGLNGARWPTLTVNWRKDFHQVIDGSAQGPILAVIRSIYLALSISMIIYDWRTHLSEASLDLKKTWWNFC